MAWDVWVSAAPPLPSSVAQLVLVSLGLPPSNAETLLVRLGGMPVDMEMMPPDGARRLRYSFTVRPRTVSHEDVTDVLPAGILDAFERRERRYRDPGVLKRLLDGIAPPEAGITVLGAAVRFGSTLTPDRAASAMKRLTTTEDPSARRYLMFSVALHAPGRAIGRLRDLTETARLDVARDAAQVLTRFLSAPEAASLVGRVLRRARREGGDEASEYYLWATDLLRPLTGKDLGFWPGGDESAAVDRWLAALEGSAG
jgi:hypothetical protein